MEWPEAVGVGLVGVGLVLAAGGVLKLVWDQGLSIWDVDQLNLEKSEGKGWWGIGLGSLMVLVGMFLAILGPSQVGDPEEGDFCDPGERAPSGFECE